MDRQAYFTRHENKVRFSMPGVLGYVWWFDRTHAFDHEEGVAFTCLATSKVAG